MALECPVVRVCPEDPRGQAGRRQVETPERWKYAKLSNAGGACCGLVKVLDSTLCHWCARPEKVTEGVKPQVRQVKIGPVSSVGRASPW